jgi:hypothetical protein
MGGREHIRNNTTSIGQWRRAKCTSQKPQDDQSLDVLGARGTSIEDGEKHVSAEEQVLAAV